MSIPGNTPFYLIAKRRADGLVDYVLMNPRGWGDQVVHRAPTAARDEEQMLGRVQDLVPPWQPEIEIHWTTKELP